MSCVGCRNIKRIGKQFTFGHQEDSHELYTQMLDCMESAMLAEAGGKAKFDLRSRVRGRALLQAGRWGGGNTQHKAWSYHFV